MSRSSRPTAYKVRPFTSVGLVVAFLLVAALGGVVAAGLALPAVAATNVTAKLSATTFDDLPTELASETLPEKSTILASDGTVLATFYLQNRVVVPMTSISVQLQHAVVATEDKRFYEHTGVDLQGMTRALAVSVLKPGSDQQGASTITQQYVKNVLIEQALEASTEAEQQAQVDAATAYQGAEGYARKLREAKLAIALEQRESKDQILEKYLNIAQFGASVYGAESAAQYYFSKPAKDLTYLEAATIAGITQNPTYWDPTRSPAKSQNRRDTVLMLMYQQNYITKAQYDQGIATPIASTLHVSSLKQGCQVADQVVAGSGYFCDWVSKVILTDSAFGATRDDRRALLLKGGLTITTTLDPRLQVLATQTIQASIPTGDQSGAAEAMSVVQPGTGQVKAMAQNTTYVPTATSTPGQTAINYNVGYPYYTTNQGFQPGSSFKVFTLLAWLQAGHSLNEVVNGGGNTPFPMSAFNSSCVKFSSKATWTVGNASEGEGGIMTVLQATANSVNRAYASMATKLDLCQIMQNAEDLGVTQALNGKEFGIKPANVIGSDNTTPLEMAGASAAFAAGGVYCTPIAILKVTDASGADLPVPSANCSQKIDPDIANTMNYALSHVWDGTMRSVPEPDFPSAGKTGTTNDNEYTWFVGYTPRLSTAFMVAGSADGFVSLNNHRIGNHRSDSAVFGSDIAGPDWKVFMTAALDDGQANPDFGAASNDLIYGKQVSVPSVVGSTVDVATATLEAAGFSVTVASGTVASVQPAGTVAKQSARQASAGATITLTLSNGAAPAATQAADTTIGGGSGGGGSGGNGNSAGNGRGNGNGGGGNTGGPDNG